MFSKKQVILKELRKIYDERSYGNSAYTEIGKSLSISELNIKTGLKINVLDNHLKALESEELIISTEITGKGETKFYYLTPKGHNALSDKIYLWRFLERFGILLAVFIALFGALNSIFDLVKSR